VGVGSTVNGVDIHFSPVRRAPAVHVRGKVVGAPADPQASVYTSLDSADRAVAESLSLRAGPPNYEFDARVRPGEYRIIARVRSGPLAFASANITATEDINGVLLTLGPAPVITGQVGIAERSHEINFQALDLRLARLDPSDSMPASADATGKFLFAGDFIRPGHYAVYLYNTPADCFVQSVKLGGREIDPENFEILASASLDVILSSTAAKITGTVVDKDGNPLPDSIATLIPIDGKGPDRKTAGDNGSFQFTSVRPGKYKLFAWEEVDNDSWQDPAFWKKYESYAAEVTAGPSETQTTQLRVIPAAEIK
jgi:hypothetical protein